MASRVLFTSRIAARSTILVPGARRTLSMSSCLRLKESSSHNPDPELSERHKQDSLAKQKAGKAHWKPELASDSEENLKADRLGPGPGEAGEAAMRRLQERTKQAAEETSKAGTSMKDHHM